MKMEGRGSRWIRFAPAAASVGKGSASMKRNWATASIRNGYYDDDD